MRKTPVVLGILSMVFGGLCVLWYAFSMASQSMVKGMTSSLGAMPHAPGTPDPAQMMKHLQEVTAQLAPVIYADLGGMMVLSLVLIVVGLGLYRRQGWSRQAALLWSGVALAFIPVRIYLQVVIMLPKLSAVMKETFAQSGLGGSMASSLTDVQTTMTAVLLVVFFAPFPIVLLLLMGRGSARNDLLS